MPLCCVCGISSGSWQSRHDNLSYHPFPETHHVLKLWQKFVQITEGEDLREKRVCSRHFNAKDVVETVLARKLNCDAIPCLYPPKSRLSSVGFTQITLENGEDDFSEVLEVAPDFITDSVTIDHDYSVTGISREPQIQVCWKVKQGDFCSQLGLEDVKKELCRLCGRKASILMPIFAALSEDMSISSKIEMHLPFKVKMDDPLPSHVCLNCNDVLNRWHELYVTCVAADAVLWKTFGKKSDTSSQIHLDSAITRVLDHVEQDVAEIEIKIQKKPLVPLILDEAGEGLDALCAERRKKKTMTSPTEEDLFSKEIDENFANFRSGVFKCRYCYEIFKSRVDRRNHVAMCRQLSAVCELCGYEVSCRKDLRKHKYKKHIKNNLPRKCFCHKCETFFQSAEDLADHIKCVHMKDHSPKYHCELCCTAFVSEQQFHIHQMNHEKGKVKSVCPIEVIVPYGSSQNSEESAVYPCPVCKETFSNAFSLVVHLTTKKKITCSVCQKVLYSEKRFILHLCGQWTCQYCSKTFSKMINCIAHERLHTGERPVKCRICDATFRTWHARRRHERRHNSEFQCSYCGKSFRCKYVFKDHVLCHEGKIFLCQICGKKFSGRKCLHKHVNAFHKNIVVPK